MTRTALRKTIHTGAHFGRRMENAVAGAALVACALLAGYEIVSRLFLHHSIRATAAYIHHGVLITGMMAAVIATRENKHLAFSALQTLFTPRLHEAAQFVTSVVTVAVLTGLSVDAWFFARFAIDPGLKVGVIPLTVIAWIVPLCCILMVWHSAIHAVRKGWVQALAPLCGLLLFIGARFVIHTWGVAALWPLGVLLGISLIAGTPIFAVLGGCAQLFLYVQSGACGIVSNEIYTMLTGTLIPTLPLFTLAGFILSESNAPGRLVAVFKSIFGWIPGGIAIMAIVVSTFFTTFTGASGVTILALGGLLYIALHKAGYPRMSITGMLTAGGSLGLLFPPSLPVILYGIVAHVDIRKVFVGGLLPGVLMTGAVIAVGVVSSLRRGVRGSSFSIRESALALWHSAGEIMIPVVIIAGFFGGVTTIVESSAVAVIMACIVVMALHRDITIRSFATVVRKALPVIGGVLIILAMASALSYYLVDAQVPRALTAWCRASIESKYVFLLALNVALLLAGCLMDIFSAIMVLGPLVVPLATAYGIDPVHTGIIFLANLELGYLTPPVGLNLFLASYRFEKPLAYIYRSVLGYLGVLVISVLCITYVPALTTWLVTVVFGP